MAQGNKNMWKKATVHPMTAPSTDIVLYAGSDIGPDDLRAHSIVEQIGRRCRAQGIPALQGDIAAHRT